MRRPFFRANTFALNPVLHEIYGGSTVATIEHASDLLATELLQGKHLDVVRNEAICPQTGHEKKKPAHCSAIKIGCPENISQKN